METAKIEKLSNDIQDLLGQSKWRAIQPTEVLDLVVRCAELHTFVASWEPGHPARQLGIVVLSYHPKIWDMLIQSMGAYLMDSGLIVEKLSEPSMPGDSMMGVRIKDPRYGHRELNVTFRFQAQQDSTDFTVEVVEYASPGSVEVTKLGSAFPELRSFEGDASKLMPGFVAHLESVANMFLRRGVVPQGYN